MHVSSLHLHPVKSLRALSVQQLELDPEGVAGDRRFMVVDPDGGFLTQRTLPRMALVDALIEGDALALGGEGFGRVRVSRPSDPRAQTLRVRIWKSEGLVAEDCGEEAAEWLTSILGTPCRLVRSGCAFRRPVKGSPPGSDDRVGFADAYPVLVASRPSLADLNVRLGEAAVPMDRFRPNIVVEGCAPYAEDTWGRVRIGRVTLRAAGPCSRCIISSTDQATGERGVEPLRTLASYRRDPSDPTHVNFAQNFVHEDKSGVIRVGDPVIPL
jgi:uncharacterized protein YcbX